MATTISSEAKTIFSTTKTIFTAIEPMVFVAKTAVSGNMTLFSAADPASRAFESSFSITDKPLAKRWW